MKISISQMLARRGLTQRKLAEQVGINPGFLSQIISGKRNPSLATLARIAEVLQVPLDLLTEPDDPGAPRHRATGFAEPPVAPYAARSDDERRAILALAGHASVPARHAVLFRVTRPTPALGLMAGDILVIDARPRPRDGQIVIVQVEDRESGEAETRAAIFRAGQPAAAFGEPEFAPGDASVMGAVCATVRLG